MGRFVFNTDLIRAIDLVKLSWREEKKKELQPLIEKACWLQFRLVDDARPGLTLEARASQYHKTDKFQKNLELIRFIQSSIGGPSSPAVKPEEPVLPPAAEVMVDEDLVQYLDSVDVSMLDWSPIDLPVSKACSAANNRKRTFEMLGDSAPVLEAQDLSFFDFKFDALPEESALVAPPSKLARSQEFSIDFLYQDFLGLKNY